MAGCWDWAIRALDDLARALIRDAIVFPRGMSGPADDHMRSASLQAQSSRGMWKASDRVSMPPTLPPDSGRRGTC